MKKIGLFLGAPPNYGGTFQYNLSMLDAVAVLPQDRFDVHICYMDPLWEDYLLTYQVKAIQVKDKYNLSADAPTMDLWIFPSQDSWNYEEDLFALSTIHDLMHRYESHFPEVKSEYDVREMQYSNMCKHAKGILVDSEVGRHHVHECYGYPVEQIFVLPFVPPKYIYENNAQDDFSEKYKLPPAFIFYPAHFWEHKNHIRLIASIDQLKDEIPNIQLVLTGFTTPNLTYNSNQLITKYIEERNLQDRVHIMGYVPDEDLPEFYRRARAVVMPSFFGPTNIPPLEAFVLGCPVAISNIYGIPEQVGDAALLFNPSSIDEMKAAIRRLWLDNTLCQSLILKGRIRAKAWGPVQFHQRLMEIINQLLK